MAQLALKEYVQSQNVQDRIRDMLKDRASQFIVSLLAIANTNEALAKCEPASVLNAAMTAASLDLPINQNLGFAYIIPYKSNAKKTVIDQNTGKSIEKWGEVSVAQFQMGYKGFIQLAQRTKLYERIEVVPVYDGDTDESVMKRLISLITPEPPSDKIIGYISWFRLLSGFSKSLYMTVENLTAHGTRYSQNFKKYKSGLWADDFDAMAKKTVIKQLISKWGPMSTELEKAIQADQAIIGDDNNLNYDDNKKDTAEDIARQKEIARIQLHIAKSNTTDMLKQCEEAVYDMDDEALLSVYKARLDELNKK